MKGVDPDLGFTGWLDARRIAFPGEPERTCDTVAELASRNGTQPPWALVVEAQSEPHPDMQEWLLEYLARFRREKRHGPYGRDKYPVGAARLNLTGAGPTTLTMALPGATGVRLELGIAIRNFAQVRAAEMLAEIAAGTTARCLLAWVSLMDGGAEEASRLEWKRLATQEPDRQRRGEYGAAAQLFSELAGHAEVWAQTLEDWNVEESKVVSRWQAKAEEKGLALGLQKGLQQGLQQARSETMRDNLLRLLRARFPAVVTEALLARIQSEDRADELSRWFDLALSSSSHDEFHKALPTG